MNDSSLMRERRSAFLSGLARAKSVSRAADEAGIACSTLYGWRRADQSFAKAWADAIETGTDLMEDEAFRRAVEGMPKPVYRGGEKVDEILDYSDAMLTFLLKARRPDKFKDKQSAVTSKHPSKLDLKGARDALQSKFAQICDSEET